MDVLIREVTKTFGSLRANDQISLNFAAGQIHGVLGENGAGKSTLMKLLSGFLRRDSGNILLNKQPANLDSPEAALRAGVGMLHQDPLDVPAFTSLENFYCASPRQAMPNSKAARRILLELAQRLNFSALPDTRIAGLTLGQRQQLEIMRLLACGAQVLILDEPTTGISAAQKDALFAALRSLAEEDRTIIFVSHKLDEVAELCHTVSVLRGGRVMGEGQMPVPQPQEHLLALMFGQDQPPAQPAQPAQPATQPTRRTDREQVPDQDAPVRTVWQLDAVTVREGLLVLRDLSLELRAGMVLGLAGLEGSGQQVLLRLLAGHLQPEAGRLLLDGANMTAAPPTAFRQSGVYYLPADRLAEGLVGAFSLTDHLALTRARSGRLIDRHAAQEAAQVAIAEYDIKATPATPMASLSGGNQQRAMLALLPPHCVGLLLDQPTRGLDVVSARTVWQRLLARRSSGTALVFASADFDELLTYSDMVLVFYGGHVSPPLPRAMLSETRLAELIGGVGFEELHAVC
jgi:simple sugar transport system ATP-binding protein